MGRYRGRDLLLAPSLLSFVRIPLAAAFVGLVHQPPWALGVLVLAGITDVLDGHLARRLGQATPTGAVVDGVLDKFFAAVVIGGLILHGQLPWAAAVLLATRELGELPLVAWWALHEDGRRARGRSSGKLAREGGHRRPVPDHCGALDPRRAILLLAGAHLHHGRGFGCRLLEA